MGTAIVRLASGKAITRISAANLPPAIASGIFDLLTAFAGAQQEDAEKKRLLGIYGEAVAGFEVVVAEHAIGWLKLHNPRNPFRPTPQDVYETCEKLVKEWRERVLHHFTGHRSAPCWGAAQDRSYGLAPKFEWGTEPFMPGALIPDVIAKGFLRDYLRYGQDRIKDLAELGRERLARIPTDCFMDGQLTAALSLIEKKERRQDEIAKFNAYLDTLDPDLRWHRRIVFNTGDNRTLSEGDLIAAARRSLQRQQAEVARRKIEVEEGNRRIVANAKPEVQAIIKNMHAASKRGDEAQHKALLAEYVAALGKHGAKPPPHLEKLNARVLDP